MLITLLKLKNNFHAVVRSKCYSYTRQARRKLIHWNNRLMINIPGGKIKNVSVSCQLTTKFCQMAVTHICMSRFNSSFHHFVWFSFYYTLLFYLVPISYSMHKHCTFKWGYAIFIYRPFLLIIVHVYIFHSTIIDQVRTSPCNCFMQYSSTF